MPVMPPRKGAGAEHQLAVVAFGFGMPRREVAVPVADLASRGGIDPVEVVEHGRHRSAEAVDMEAAEADLARRLPPRIEGAQAAREVQDLAVAPRRSREAGERVVRERYIGSLAQVAVDPRRVRPVNRPGFVGGCLSWVRRPRLGRRRGYDSALRPRREGRFQSARGGDGGCTSRPTPGWRTRPPRRSATGHAGGSPLS